MNGLKIKENLCCHELETRTYLLSQQVLLCLVCLKKVLLSWKFSMCAAGRRKYMHKMHRKKFCVDIVDCQLFKVEFGHPEPWQPGLNAWCDSCGLYHVFHKEKEASKERKRGTLGHRPVNREVAGVARAFPIFEGS